MTVHLRISLGEHTTREHCNDCPWWSRTMHQTEFSLWAWCKLFEEGVDIELDRSASRRASLCVNLEVIP